MLCFFSKALVVIEFEEECALIVKALAVSSQYLKHSSRKKKCCFDNNGLVNLPGGMEEYGCRGWWWEQRAMIMIMMSQKCHCVTRHRRYSGYSSRLHSKTKFPASSPRCKEEIKKILLIHYIHTDRAYEKSYPYNKTRFLISTTSLIVR